MNLLEDVFIIENLQIINEGRGSGPMKICGCFQRADEANNNKRIYRKPLLEREITKLADAMTERRLMGELDHPQNDSVKLSNVSHLITGLKMKGNEVIGEAEILNTPAGKVAQALIEGGVKIGISSRGMGTVTEELDGKRYVNEDFKLITWDIVADPSTRGAYPGLTESTEIQEIIDRVYPEAQKVKNFTTLLKEELTVESDPIFRGRSGSKELGTATAGVISRERREAHGAPGGPMEKSLKKSAPVAGQAMIISEPGRRKADIRARLKPASLAKLAAQQNSSTQFVNFMRDKLMEWEAHPLAKHLARQAGSEEGRMSATGKNIRDDLVRREAATTQANVDRKLSDLASPKTKKGRIIKRKRKKVRTNIKTKDAIQGSLNRRSALSRSGVKPEGSAFEPAATAKPHEPNIFGLGKKKKRGRRRRR